MSNFDHRCVKEIVTDDYIYSFHFIGKTFSEARNDCKEYHSGSLAIADNQKAVDAIVNNAPSSYNNGSCQTEYFRIGLVNSNGSQLKWVDGNAFDNNLNLSTSAGQSSTCQAYAFFTADNSKNVTFRPIFCSYELAFICQNAKTKTPMATSSTVETPSNSFQATSSVSKPTLLSSSYSSLLIGGLAACAILLVVLAIWMMYRKLKRKTSESSSIHYGSTEKNQSVITDRGSGQTKNISEIDSSNYAAIKFNETEPVVNEINVKHGNSTVEANKNETYSAVDKPKKKTSNPVNDVYAVINKPKKQPIDDNAVTYAVVRKPKNAAKEESNVTFARGNSNMTSLKITSF